jgi:ABC-type bacteriocin/lantibiotic exporter with double-glycine peptidase domain
VLAVLMLIAGETVLKHKLTGIALLCYWLACFVFTSIAAIVAIKEATRVGIEGRNEQKDLIEETIRQIERDKSSGDKPRKP